MMPTPRAYSKKVLSAFSLTMMNIAMVGSLQMITVCAVYGYSLFFFYLLAIAAFFLPCILVTGELATTFPTTGGVYIWVEKAFGRSWGFFTICLLWICNLIWYPTIFSLIATSIAYLILPELAESKLYMITTVLALFWGVTLLNCLGIRVSSLISTICAFTGIILPGLLLVILGIYWASRGAISPMKLNASNLFPHMGQVGNLAFLIQIVISLSGMEMSAVHAGNVKDPKRDYPKALFYSAGVILFIVIGAALAIGQVIPSSQIGLLNGIFEAFKLFFATLKLSWLLPLMILLIILGNLGNVTAWMISSTRGMQVACIECKMPPFLQWINRFGAPKGILILEAIIFSLVCLVFLLMPSVSASYWTLLDLASQTALAYYFIFFIAAIALRRKFPRLERPFRVPGGFKGMALCAGLGAVTSLVAIGFGFLPPVGMIPTRVIAYQTILIMGLAITLLLPIIFLQLARHNR